MYSALPPPTSTRMVILCKYFKDVRREFDEFHIREHIYHARGSLGAELRTAFAVACRAAAELQAAFLVWFLLIGSLLRVESGRCASGLLYL